MRRLGLLLRCALVAASLLATSAPTLAAPVGGTHVVGAPPTKGRHAPLAGVVNLNTADEAALELLPGVGPTKSARIVEHRKTKPFHKVEELTHVKGFGRKSMARLRPYLAVSGPTTLGVEERPPAPAPAK
jgi:competence protein ComEA